MSTREGLILIFDVKTTNPFMVHWIKPFQQPQTVDYVKQMNLDKNRNALICRSKTGLISCIQIMNRIVIKSAVIENINSYENDKTDSISQFNWLSRMSCYVEGTTKGCLKIRDVEKLGECIMMLQTGF